MFEREKDIYHTSINKHFQSVMSFYYDNKKKSTFREVLKAVKKSLKVLKKNLTLIISPAKPHTELIADLQKPYWYYVNTRNNLHALSYIFDYYSDKSILVNYGSAKFTTQKVDLQKYYTPKPVWRVFGFLIYLFANPKYSHRRWKAVANNFHLYDYYTQLLLKYKPKVIFFSNDHTINSRALIVAANDLKITTIYLEHATAKKQYPALNFSLSILDGEYSYNTYEEVGKTIGEYRNIGVPRLQIKEEYLVTTRDIKRIGLAFNMRDSVQKIENIINYVTAKYPDMEVVVRQHPRERRQIAYPDAPNLSFSKADSENSLTFLRNLDMVIGNNSALLLEAVTLNVFAVQYNLSNGEQTDTNSYIKYNIVTEIQNLNELDEIFQKGRESGMYYRNNAKFFDESINTPYQFSVQDKVIEVIDEFIKNSPGSTR